MNGYVRILETLSLIFWAILSEVKMTEKEIIDKYKKLHDDLSWIYYNQEPMGQLSKEAFETQHGIIWTDMKAELIAGGFLNPPEPVRDAFGEIDVLKARIALLEKG